MTEYDNTNSGALFKNDDKDEEHPNWADYQGSIDVEGTNYWISAWLKKSKKGVNYMSLSVRPKGSQRAPTPQPSQEAPPAAATDDFDDDIPF
ncbi:hypothetical protein LCGC14_2329580 [marine sediment metagenome]|uniref:DUF736 domain-containing protein n=1 Tax=marine sediment metagenome TaxID=412755 RepID=A0A0F9FAA7_9ZZZZ